MKYLDQIKSSPVKMDILMRHVNKLLNKNKKQILDRFDLTCSQFEILTAIHFFTENNMEIIQVSLSEETNIDPMTTSTILRNLERKGIIKRYRSATNTRTVIVEFTSEGKEMYKEAASMLQSSSDEIYQGVNKGHLTSQLLLLSDKLNKLNC